MHDDLQEAQASVEWAEAQIVVMQERFIGWQRSGPYKLGLDPDPQTGGQLITARLEMPLYPLLQTDTGMVIHSLRSSLDILMGTLATRNGKASGKHPHFPIRGSEAEWDAHVAKDIEGKGWLTNIQVATIKSAWPYQGTDNLLFTLHHLDIMTKHHRLLSATPTAIGNWLSILGPGVEPYVSAFYDKTTLYRLAPGTAFHPTQGNTAIISKITINEPVLGLRGEEAFGLLRRYVAKVTDVIALVDAM